MKTTLTAKLLKFFLPLLILPIVLMLAFYYAYLTHLIKDETIELSKTLFIQQNSIIEQKSYNQTNLENILHLNKNELLPCFTIIDKDLNILATSKKESVNKIYNKHINVINKYIEEVFSNVDLKLTHIEENYIMIKPFVNSKNEVIAFSICDYKKTLDKKLAIIEQTFIYIILIVIFISFINIILTIIFAFNIISPIKSLIEGTKIISEGDLSHKIDISVDDEIGVLIKYFNIMTEKLKLADQKAKLANEAKSTFLANMSHEIRTPMNAIVGFVDILIKKEKDSKKLKQLNIVKQSGSTLLEIINDILDLSKIESGKLSIEKTLFITKEPFSIIDELFYEKAKEKNIKLNLNFDEKLPENGYGDPTRIKQVYTNLLSNAIKFSNENSSIDIDVLYDEAKNRLICSVKDKGIGIKHENIANIFTPFEQEDSSITRRFGGTGLGLSISKTLTELMGGELKVKSEFNHGSTFSFSLDIFFNVPEIKLNNNLEIDSQKIDIKGKVLIVEDNKTNQLLLRTLLDDFCLDIVVANDGLEAVEAFKNEQFSLILMDENMPNMNGIEATKQIRKLESKKESKTPIVAVTANALVEDRKHFLDSGMDDYISKPIDYKELQRVLKKFL